MAATGKIVQVIGSTFDVEFDEEHVPPIYNALRVGDGELCAHLTGEVQQHLGGGRARCVALGSTDGLRRGADVIDTGRPITCPSVRACSGEYSIFWASR